MSTRMPSPALVVSAAAIALVTACTSQPAPSLSGSTTVTTSASTTTAPTTSPKPSTPPPLAVTVKGAPAALTAVIAKKYAGKQGIAATAALGTWKGRKIAVVTAGADVTLLAAVPDWRIAGGWWPSLGQPEPQVGGKDFVLALGSDAREGTNQPVARSRADAIQLIGRDGKRGGGVLGIPRDAWVNLTTGGAGKINGAMAFGGPSAMTATVARATGIPVKKYVVMSFTNVVDTVNALGGLPMVSDMSLPAKGIRKGPAVFNGHQVLWYARERKALADGDFGRSRHQSQLILAAAFQGRRKGILWAPTVISALDRRSVSNLSAAEMLQWVGSFYVLEPSKVGRGVATGTVGTAGGQSVVRLGAPARARFNDLRDGNLTP